MRASARCAPSACRQPSGKPGSLYEHHKELAAEYRRRYVAEILDRVDLAPIFDSLPGDSATALLCVERDFQACHRSLIAERLRDEHHVLVSHLQA